VCLERSDIAALFGRFFAKQELKPALEAKLFYVSYSPLALNVPRTGTHAP